MQKLGTILRTNSANYDDQNELLLDPEHSDRI